MLCLKKSFYLSTFALFAVLFVSCFITSRNVSAFSDDNFTDVMYCEGSGTLYGGSSNSLLLSSILSSSSSYPDFPCDLSSLDSSSHFYVYSFGFLAIRSSSTSSNVNFCLSASTSCNIRYSTDYSLSAYLQTSNTSGIQVQGKIIPAFSSSSLSQVLPLYLTTSSTSSSYSVSYSLSLIISEFSNSSSSEPCPTCPEVPDNPYDPKFDEIKQAILIIPATALVIYFFFCIYRMLLKGRE